MPLRLAFESARSTLFTVGLVAKKRIFLEQAIWKTAPWQGSGLPPKTAQNELVDIMVGIPGYMQDTVEIQQGGAKDKQKKALLLARLKADLSTLFDWRWKWEAHNPNAAIEMEPGALPVGRRVCDFRLFRKVLWFRNFTQATEILLYNAVLLCLLGALWQFDPPAEVEVPAPTNSILKRPDEIFSLLEPAEEICRGFEYQLLNIDNSQDSTLFWLLPLGVASKVLEAEPEYGRWIQSMLDTSRVTRGYGSGMSEFAFGHYQFPHIGHARKRRMRDR
ncbi:uncharacterized protein HMPREF1541_05026 [Cyphellophora europaea CBS 101466]|uniref:Uncharacterized protein n=1 Tax=Cyphellophora europaea (strain CBS 101466) TaxID=1220924 RepID=W2RW46_CYPE1|nr:uncharacterized protein HMPREF1541_05026 [Cyphellophora europaea CBS 101466]ETN40746.1 hypothetical protein HMPREF1541_05026 [Cyphellophora europaea CBS 101466]